ncbi:histone, partial [Colletotrichum incanum]
GFGGAKRDKKRYTGNIGFSFNNPAIRRLARRGGVKRISHKVYSETRDAAEKYLKLVIRNAVIYTDHAKRRTVSSLDVVYALKRLQQSIYGFDYPPEFFSNPSIQVDADV